MDVVFEHASESLGQTLRFNLLEGKIPVAVHKLYVKGHLPYDTLCIGQRLFRLFLYSQRLFGLTSGFVGGASGF